MSQTYQIVRRAAKESAAIVEQFCKANGEILLPILGMIESASQVVDTVVHEIGGKTLEEGHPLSSIGMGTLPAQDCP